MITLSPSSLRLHELSDGSNWITNENYNITRLNNTLLVAVGNTLNLLGDVSITSIQNNQVLRYQTSNDLFVNFEPPIALTTTTLEEITTTTTV